MTLAEGRTAVMVIRAWHEGGAEPGAVVARLTQTTDVDEPGREESAAAGEDAILAAVAAWLRSFADRPG